MKKTENEEKTEAVLTPHNYHGLKNTYVHFDGNKKRKLKLRKYIGDLATKLSDENLLPYNENRIALINYFEAGGLEHIAKEYNKEIKKAIDARK